MMNNANDGAEAAHSKSFLYPFERIRKISVARVHWMWFFDQPHYQHICHRLRLSADLVEYLLRTFLSWQMSFLSDWWIYLLPEKHICYPINTNISSCYLPLPWQRRWPLWWSESTKTPIFVVFLLTRRKVGYMKLKNGLYCQKNTRKSCLFSPPNTVWPAERRKTAIFADFRRFWPKDTKITPKQARNRHRTPILHRKRYYRGNSWDILNLPTAPA